METGKPRISVLMAVYEPRTDWLREQLLSLNAQTYPNLYLYIRDDGSSDASFAELCSCVRECVSAFPFKIARNEKNLGSNKTFALLTEEADGDLFAYCDQDDIWMPQKLEKLQSALSGTGARLAYADMSVIDETGRQTARSLREIRPRLSYESGENLAPKIFFRNCIAGCSMLICAPTARRAVPFPKDTVCDHWLALLAASEGAVRFVPEPLVRYRQHARNQTGILTGVSDRESYLRYKVAPLEERLAMYRQHAIPSRETEAFVRARVNGSVRDIWAYRNLAPYEAKFEIALRLLPDALIRRIIRRIQ